MIFGLYYLILAVLVGCAAAWSQWYINTYAPQSELAGDSPVVVGLVGFLFMPIVLGAVIYITIKRASSNE